VEVVTWQPLAPETSAPPVAEAKTIAPPAIESHDAPDDVPAREDAPADPPAAAPVSSPSAPPALQADDFETMQTHDDAYDETRFEPVGMSDPEYDGPPDDFEAAALVQDEAIPAVFSGERKKSKAPR